MSEEKKEVEQTIYSQADVDEKKPTESELDGDKSKNVEEVEKEAEELRERLKKAEHKIVKLKGEKKEVEKEEEQKTEFNIDSIKEEVLKEVEGKLTPKLQELSELEKLKKENRELKEAYSSKKSQSGLGDAPSERKPRDNKPKPTEEDVRIAQTVGMTVENYMKYKRKI